MLNDFCHKKTLSLPLWHTISSLTFHYPNHINASDQLKLMNTLTDHVKLLKVFKYKLMLYAVLKRYSAVASLWKNLIQKKKTRKKKKTEKMMPWYEGKFRVRVLYLWKPCKGDQTIIPTQKRILFFYQRWVVAFP